MIVDFPMPGSPEIRVREPLTRPPPNTRFSSPISVSRRVYASPLISVSGSAFACPGGAASARSCSVRAANTAHTAAALIVFVYIYYFFFDHCIPSAADALTHPFRTFVSAFLTYKYGLCFFCHKHFLRILLQIYYAAVITSLPLYFYLLMFFSAFRRSLF